MTKAQSEASIAQFGPSDIAASLTMREVLENPDTSKVCPNLQCPHCAEGQKHSVHPAHSCCL